MTRNRIIAVTILGVFGAIGWLTFHLLARPRQTEALAEGFLPGPLSQAHALLENECMACHVPNEGAEGASCINCHVNNTNLLKRQPTAFHGSISSCKECHLEHQGGLRPPVQMSHKTLAEIGIKHLQESSSEPQNSLIRSFLAKKNLGRASTGIFPINSQDEPIVATLDCISCHATQDKHQGLFGSGCLNCHTTQTWNIKDYRHPSPSSRECVQCHQAPPSHYMMHFEMVSKKVAGHEHAVVSQCHLCHQTTSWNDIKGVGWYKHH